MERDKAKHAEQQRRYAKSAKGRQAIYEWTHSEEGKAKKAAAQRRYEVSEKGRATTAKYLDSEKGIIFRFKQGIRSNAARRQGLDQLGGGDEE